ncbi:MAG: hypothetical protein KDK97_23985, partial [Verrucomicrobiales bacterium]|nr:hypothetical protein [Verrucomicrobiales bacterium]
LAAELPYFQQLQDSLNRFVRAHPHPESVGQPNIRLTIDRPLHSNVNRIFLNAVRTFNATRSPFADIQQQPASVCIMNALNGDVLAMPSYPAPADVQTLRERAQTGSLRGVTDAKLRRLSQNQNLMLGPIGSTTKPLFASAVWDTRPDLMGLIVDEPAGGRRDLLGYHLTAAFGTKGPRTLDSTGFLLRSSNDYTLHLGLLILAKDVRIGAGGKPVFPEGKADLSAYFRGDAIPGGLNRPDVPAFPKMSECYDVGLVQKLTDGPAGQWDIGILAPMLRQIGVEETAMAAPALDEKRDSETAQIRDVVFNQFSGVLPERANLQLDTISSVRGRYTSMLLGSGTNYWSNLKLAEAYCRLGTGRMVRARLTADPEHEVKFEDIPKLPLQDKTLAAVHKGMSQCAEGAPNSTTGAEFGSAIRKARTHFAAKGLKFFAICKTGTATRISEKKENGQVVEPLRECAAFCLYLEVQDQSGNPVAALSSATYLQDRGS